MSVMRAAVHLSPRVAASAGRASSRSIGKSSVTAVRRRVAPPARGVVTMRAAGNDEVVDDTPPVEEAMVEVVVEQVTPDAVVSAPVDAQPVEDVAPVTADFAPAANATDEIVYTLQGPEPVKFGVADGELTNVLTASASFVTRAVSGALCEGWTPAIIEGACPEGTYTFGELGGRYLRESSDVGKYSRPAKPIKMYEFEGCPFCKKVREAQIWLDLDVEFYPCPQNGPTFREFVKTTGGKAQFPYMVDDNTGTAMYESDAIIDYMYDKYGPGKDKVSSLLRAGAFTILTAGIGLAPRGGAGSKYTAAKMPDKPITLYSYEASPFCKLVREKLVELEIPHLLKASGRGSPKRQEMFDKRGRFQAPYIEDPNTGVAMFESAAIVKYLEQTYAA